MLHARHNPALMAYLMARLPQEAANLSQESWLRVQVQLQKRPAMPHFRAWLFTIARNLIHDLHRKKKPQGLSEEIDVVDHRSDGSDLDLLHRERIAAMKGCLERLTPEQREIITAVSEGLSPVEMAERFQISRANVDQRKSRGLVTLKACVEAKLP